MKKIYFILFISVLLTNYSFGQKDLKITPCKTEQEVKQLLKKTILKEFVTLKAIKNLEFHGDPRCVGSYTNGKGLSFPENQNGVVMATGLVKNLEGANNVCDKDNGPFNIGIKDDPDLNKIANTNTYDGCIIEFDFDHCYALGNMLKINYVFGTEEYGNTTHSKMHNDCMGIFFSAIKVLNTEFEGPFSNKAYNISIVPLTNDYVCIDNLNCGNSNSCMIIPPAKKDNSLNLGKNCQYLKWNDHFLKGDQSQLNILSLPFTAQYGIPKCGTYHLKIAIADAYDDKVISALFLEDDCFFDLFVLSEISYSNSDYKKEICKNVNEVEYKLNIKGQFSQDCKLPLVYEGTAIRGVDYLFDNKTNLASDTAIVPQSKIISLPIKFISTGNSVNERKSIIIKYLKHYHTNAYLTDTIWIQDQEPNAMIEVNANDQISIPSLLSPNGDGDNDYFKVQSEEAVKDYHCVIYNMLGMKIYQSKDIHEQWNATVNGQTIPSGSYIAKVQYKTLAGKNKFKSQVFIVR
ncbi:MAG: choice-of-anchor L domain-containing protein [Bacteroidales bacterium]